MLSNHRPLWLYPLFQIPGILLGIFLVLAMLFWLLGLGRPNVAVTIALDLSSSTYTPQPFNAPGTVMAQEVAAVRAYVERSSQQLKVPNQIQVIGFAKQVVSLTNGFTDNKQQLETELNQSLANPNLRSQLGDGTNFDQAIEQGTKALAGQNQCRELLLVTDGQADISPLTIAQAASQKVKINALVVGADAPRLQAAASATQGVYTSYASEAVSVLQSLLADKFFPQFNSNLRWVVLWLGAAWVALMWLLTLPLDRWVLHGWMGLPWNLSGQLALGNAVFWTVLTPFILWQLWQFLGLPFFASC